MRVKVKAVKLKIEKENPNQEKKGQFFSRSNRHKQKIHSSDVCLGRPWNPRFDPRPRW